MAGTKEIKKYLSTFATQGDIAAARKWVAERGNDVLSLLKEHEGALIDAWKHLFAVETCDRREAFLELDDAIRHLLLVRASELYSNPASKAHLPDLDELSHRFIVATYERYTRSHPKKTEDNRT